MGLKRTNQVSGDEEGLLDWSQVLLQSGAPEQSKPLQQSESLKCPRCGSMNTKFCYYNNYNRSQPRHFCKSCKRHWTKGGTLRNVPVGGGRKNKRPRASTPAAPKIPSTSAAPCSNFSLSSGDQKFSASSISLYQTLIQPSTPSFEDTTDRIINNIVGTKNFNGGSRVDSTGLIDEDQNPIMEFHLSALNAYEYNYAAAAANLESMDESTITTVNMDEAWGGLDAPSSPLELASYWNWSDEMEALITTVNAASSKVVGKD